MTPTIADRVIRVIIQATGVNPQEPLNENTALVGAGISLDSVAVLELLVGLEKEFQTEVNPDKLLQAQALKTVGTLARFIAAQVNGTA